ncbi:MAG: N-acetylmuramoyl-L-alanine amidase-like domain-containing protein [Bacteroidales bacterium]
MIKRILFPCFFTFTLLFSSNAQTKEDSLIFKQYKAKINAKLPLDKVIAETGKFFLGKPYVANTLEVNDTEQLVVNLRELDCTTFVETTLALTRTAKSKDFAFSGFLQNLTQIRYRNGKLNQYPSRLHYFSDWISDNQEKGIIKDITQKIGGDSIQVNVGFMSKNPDKYKALTAHSEFIPTIVLQENAIRQRTYFFIPKTKIASISCKIKSGDIIAITTSFKGLDISHVGFALWQDKELHFLHASSQFKKVIVSEKILADYVNGVRSNTGIIVLRSSK